MSHTFSYNSGVQAFELTFLDKVKCDDIVRLLSYCFEHPKFHFGSHYLFDFRQAKLIMSLGDLHKLMNFIDNIRGKAKTPYRIIVVNSEPVNLTILRQWESFSAESSPENFQISDSYDKALSWLQSVLV